MPAAAVYPGLALLAAGIAIVTWGMTVNRFAETSVRIQNDRGHTVITSGPYRLVRHPMYVGAILLYAATPLILGSLWAAALSAVIMILFLIRTALEDRTLRRELPGYADYAAHTRYRLLPGVW
jgi:protein-S-isoprenylcysteine O-methyltransferase Ste14